MDDGVLFDAARELRDGVIEGEATRDGDVARLPGVVIHVDAGIRRSADVDVVSDDADAGSAADPVSAEAVDEDIGVVDVAGQSRFGNTVVAVVIRAAVADVFEVRAGGAGGLIGDLEAGDIDKLGLFKIEGGASGVGDVEERLGRVGVAARVVLTEDPCMPAGSTGGDWRHGAEGVAGAVEGHPRLAGRGLIRTSLIEVHVVSSGFLPDDDGIPTRDLPLEIVLGDAVGPEVAHVVEGAGLIHAGAGVVGIMLAVALARGGLGGVDEDGSATLAHIPSGISGSSRDDGERDDVSRGGPVRTFTGAERSVARSPAGDGDVAGGKRGDDAVAVDGGLGRI